MTDADRELAVYVARWAGWHELAGSWYDAHGVGCHAEDSLTDAALAFRAREELEKNGCVWSGVEDDVHFLVFNGKNVSVSDEDACAKRLSFKVHRAVFGGDDA